MKKSKLIAGGILLSSILSVVSISFSIAWYSSSSQLRIENIEISVNTDYTLRISDKDPSSFIDEEGKYDHIAYLRSFENHAYLDEDNSPLVGHSSLSSKLLEPVTTMNVFKENWHDEASWLKNKENKPKFLGPYQDLGSETPYLPPVSEAGYYSQTLYLFSDRDVYATLDPYGCIFNGVPVAIQDPDKNTNVQRKEAIEKYNAKVLAQQEIEQSRIHQLNKEACILNRFDKEDDIDDSAVEKWTSHMDTLYKALRISILVPDDEYDHTKEDYSYAVLDPFKEQDTLFGGRLNNSIDSYYDNYRINPNDPDSLKREIIYGDIDETTRDKAVYSASVETENKANSGTISEYDFSCFTAYTEKNCYAFDLDESLNQADPLIVAKEHSYAIKDLGERDSSYLIPIYKNTPRKIVLSVYLEGWDLDCISSTMGAYFTSVVSFKIAREM